MVKAKRKQLAALAAEKDDLSGEEDSWVVVKMQKITILVPPLSPVQPPPQSSRIERLQTRTRKSVKSKCQKTTHNRHCKQSRSKLKNSSACPWKEEMCFSRGGTKVSVVNNLDGPPGLIQDHLPNSTSGMASECSNLLTGANFAVHERKHISRTFKPAKTIGTALSPPDGLSEAWNTQLPSSLANLMQQEALPLPIVGQNTFWERSLSCLNVGALENQKMRASNIERNLKRAGGLSRWLLSQGLGQFVQLFQRENVDEVQLLSLTMHKLKDMGADAVGPRRKLVHAIDCLSRPCYF
ncbi:hypothetical protein ACLOJK_001574 [Asimina triloba]